MAQIKSIHMFVQFIQMLLVRSNLFLQLCQFLHLLLTDEVIFARVLALCEGITEAADISS